MYTIDRCLTLDTNIKNLEALDNKYIALSTESAQARINSCINYDNQLIIESEKLTPDVKAMSFSPNVELLAFGVKSSLYVLDTRIGEILNEIPINAKEINILTFDTSSKYLIVGTKYGRVFQYRYNNPSLLARLASFPYDRTIPQPKNFTNFVSAITFSGSKIACSGFGGAILVTDLHVNAHKEVITNSTIKTNCLSFADANTLISGKDNGDIDIIHLNATINIDNIKTNFSTIKHIIPIPNTNYIFVNSQQNFLSIIDTKENKVINEKYATFDDVIINMVLLDNDTIVLALKNSNVIKLNLPTQEILDRLIKTLPLHKVFEKTENATIIQNYKSYKQLEKKYENIYKMATKALINNDKQLAIKLLKNYISLKSKQKDIKLLFKTFQYYDKFKLLVQSRRYVDAYKLCDKFPPLKETDEFKEMEALWKNAFLNAQKELLAGNLSKAKQLISIYKNIPSKKEMCSFIYDYPNEFVKFLKALIKKDFKTTDKIVEKFSAFTHIPTYVNLTKKIEGTIKLVENCILKSNTKLARKHLQRLKNIPHIESKVKELSLQCYHIEQLQSAYELNDLETCYKLLDTKKILHHIELGKKLEQEWAKIISKCEEYALQGDVENVKNTLKELINMESRKNRLGDLLRVAYHTKIKQSISNQEEKKAKDKIFSYLKIFGIDQEIEDITDMFNKKFSDKIELDDKKYKRGFRDNWRISIDDI